MTSAGSTHPNEFELKHPPSDGISSVRFGEDPNLLLVSSWDSSVRLYDVQQNALKTTYHHKAAALDCCFDNNGHTFSGGLDRTIKMVDLGTSTEVVLGSHDKPVRCLDFSQEEGLVVSGSWDKTVKLWDHRNQKNCISTHDQLNKVFTMALSGLRLVVGTAGRQVNIYDLRRMSEPEQRRESSLKYQTRCIRAFCDGSGYALSSIEGRVAMEYFDPSEEVQARKYAFKCHRQNVNGVDTVYPVNTMAFHPRYGTFATGGCDGYVNIWDGQNKKRLCQFHKFPTSISSLAFNSTGTTLAIASSYTFEEGEKDHPDDAIFIRSVTEYEVKPKAKTQ